MIFVASPKYAQFLVMGAAAAGFLEFFWLWRVIAWNVWRSGDIRSSMKKGIRHSRGCHAIGSGGLFGRGLGNSVQKLGFLPEAQNDMIFSIICEELGLIGASLVIGLFLILIWRFFVIATSAKDLTGALIATEPWLI